jgi:hypothetical protein
MKTLIISLNEIFKHYKKDYNLNTELTFYLSYSSCYSPALDRINIDYHYISDIYDDKNNKKRHNYNSFLELASIVLLHEIKHAIDYKADPIQFDKEVDYLIENPSLTKLDYPLERRADEFANREIEKWKKHLS